MSRPINTALWQQLTQDVTAAMGAWRLAHPTATLREIEVELDARLSRMRARLLEDLALTSSSADWATTPPVEPPRCPQCDHPLQDAGTKPRTLQTHGGHDLTLERRYGTCPACGAGLFPLDDELGLLPGSLTPRLQEALVRLSTQQPSFAKAATELTFFTGATLHADTARRRTEAAGAVLVAHQTAEAAHPPGTSCRTTRPGYAGVQRRWGHGADCRRSVDGGAHAGRGRGAAAAPDAGRAADPDDAALLFLTADR